MHWPDELTDPCSWYCQRALTGGCQHEPADELHGTGAGRAAVTADADRVADVAVAALAADPENAGATAITDRTSRVLASIPNG